MTRALRWVLPLAMAASGCYSHAAVRPENVQPGALVQARITAARAEQLTDELGRESRVLRGRIVGEEGGGILLQVPALTGAGGPRLEQRVLLPAPEIVELELRTLDRGRTAGLAALLAAAGGYVLLQQFRSGGKDDPPGGDKPGGGNQVILPFPGSR